MDHNMAPYFRMFLLYRLFRLSRIPCVFNSLIALGIIRVNTEAESLRLSIVAWQHTLAA